MDKYYVGLLLSSLVEAQKNLSMAQQHAINAGAPVWLVKNLSRNQAALRNRHDDVLRAMRWQKQDEA